MRNALCFVVLAIAAGLSACSQKSAGELAETEAHALTASAAAPVAAVSPVDEAYSKDAGAFDVFLDAVKKICPDLPQGQWVLTSYEIEGAISSISSAEADTFVGQTLNISNDRVTLGDRRCDIDRISIDIWKYDENPSNKAVYGYVCKVDPYVRFMSMSLGPNCTDRKFHIDEAIYNLE